MSYSLKLEAKEFGERVNSVHTELDKTPDKKTGKLLSTKVELKDSKTWGDRFKYVEMLLTKLGIHVMSRTNEKAAALTLKKFAIANNEHLSKKLQTELGDIVEVLKKRAEPNAKESLEFDKIKADILALTPIQQKPPTKTPSKTPSKTPTPKVPSDKPEVDDYNFQMKTAELLNTDYKNKDELAAIEKNLDKFFKLNKKYVTPEALGTMLGKIITRKFDDKDLQKKIVQVFVDNGAKLDVKHSTTTLTPLEAYQKANKADADPAIVALLTVK